VMDEMLRNNNPFREARVVELKRYEFRQPE